MVAGLLLAEIEAWWTSDRLPEVDVQVEVAAPGSVARHPVLPLPLVADPARPDGGSALSVPAAAVHA